MTVFGGVKYGILEVRNGDSRFLSDNEGRPLVSDDVGLLRNYFNIYLSPKKVKGTEYEVRPIGPSYNSGLELGFPKLHDITKMMASADLPF